MAQRGLVGILEMILERHQNVLQVLQAITLHLEQSRASSADKKPMVLLHCTLGKDRTGVIAMLCQSIVGDSDDDIMEEFAKSHCVQDLARVKLKAHFGDLVDSSNLPRADAETMRDTLHYLRDKYGSVDGYLDCIGLDASWRQRFVAVAFE
jgi:protein tyrosine/serine phosphatase